MKTIRCILAALAVFMCTVPSFAEKDYTVDYLGTWKWSDSTGIKLVAILYNTKGTIEFTIRNNGSLKPLETGLLSGYYDGLCFSKTSDYSDCNGPAFLATKISDNEYKLVRKNGGETIRFTRFVDEELFNDFLNKARALYSRNDYDNALEMSIKASQINSRNVDALLIQAECYKQKGADSDCYQVYEKIITIDPNNKKVIPIKKWLDRFQGK